MEQPIARGVNIPAAIVADLEKMVADTIIDEVPVDEEEDEELSLSSTGLPSYIYNIDVLKEEDINGVVESDHDRQGLFLSMAAANMAARQEIGDRGSKTAISFKEELEYHEFQDWDGMETHWVSATGLKVEARVIRGKWQFSGFLIKNFCINKFSRRFGVFDHMVLKTFQDISLSSIDLFS